MKHWEFTGEEKVKFGVTLKRIRATVDFVLKCGVKISKGEDGGWIETENNLSGDAWVSGDAQVSGDARVYGNARVSGDAQVSGDARVYGDAWVSGNARVSGDAQVSGDANYMVFGPAGSRNDFTTFTRDAKGTIYVACGCFYGTIDKFREKVKNRHAGTKHETVYLAAASLAELQIDTTPFEEPKEEGESK